MGSNKLSVVYKQILWGKLEDTAGTLEELNCAQNKMEAYTPAYDYAPNSLERLSGFNSLSALPAKVGIKEGAANFQAPFKTPVVVVTTTSTDIILQSCGFKRTDYDYLVKLTIDSGAAFSAEDVITEWDNTTETGTKGYVVEVDGNDVYVTNLSGLFTVGKDVESGTGSNSISAVSIERASAYIEYTPIESFCDSKSASFNFFDDGGMCTLYGARGNINMSFIPGERVMMDCSYRGKYKLRALHTEPPKCVIDSIAMPKQNDWKFPLRVNNSSAIKLGLSADGVYSEGFVFKGLTLNIDNSLDRRDNSNSDEGFDEILITRRDITGSLSMEVPRGCHSYINESSPTGNNIVLESVSGFNVDDIVFFSRAGEYARISAIDTYTKTLTLVRGATVDQTLYEGDTVEVVAFAVANSTSYSVGGSAAVDLVIKLDNGSGGVPTLAALPKVGDLLCSSDSGELMKVLSVTTNANDIDVGVERSAMVDYWSGDDNITTATLITATTGEVYIVRPYINFEKHQNDNDRLYLETTIGDYSTQSKNVTSCYESIDASVVDIKLNHAVNGKYADGGSFCYLYVPRTGELMKIDEASTVEKENAVTVIRGINGISAPVIEGDEVAELVLSSSQEFTPGMLKVYLVFTITKVNRAEAGNMQLVNLDFKACADLVDGAWVPGSEIKIRMY